MWQTVKKAVSSIYLIAGVADWFTSVIDKYQAKRQGKKEQIAETNTATLEKIKEIDEDARELQNTIDNMSNADVINKL